ncbi:hypothetical protein KKH39_01985 [Patescibacteria group bacterium]|nr:hypothetical protein [Patescibacteria group bacterium]
MFDYKKTEGFSLMELLVVISFVSVMVFLILGVSNSNNKVKKLNEETTQAMFYASEALEAVKLMAWDDISTGQYSVELTGDSWTLSSGSQLLDGFYTRQIEVSDVYRANISNGHSYGEIVSSGGYLDPDTKKAQVIVVWDSKSGHQETQTLETYLHRFKADRWHQTDWVGGDGQELWSDETKFSFKDSGIDNSIPGIVTLKAGFIDWSYANTTSTYDTPGNFDDNDVYEINDIAYLVTENNSYGSEFYILDVSDISSPTLISSMDIGAAVKSVFVQDNYAYIATDSNYREFQVIDVSNPSSPFIADYYDMSGNSNALDVMVDESKAYVVQGDYLYSFDITDPTDIRYLDRISVDDQARELFLSESYVYIATEDDNKELQIMDVTNPANLSAVGQYDLPGSLKGTDVNVRGSRAFISTQNNGSGAEFFVIDVTNPANPSLLGSYAVDETIHSFAIVGPYALVGTNFLDQELVVLDISFPETINEISGFDLNGYVLGMSANCSVIYAATSGNTGEFFIISTDVLDCEYADYGTMDSSTFDTGSNQVTYNWIAWTGTEPSGTDIRFQLATSDNEAGPWNFIGPDGSSSSYYTNSIQEYINYSAHQDDRYIRYRLFLDSDSEWQVPVVEEVFISYSTYP